MYTRFHKSKKQHNFMYKKSFKCVGIRYNNNNNKNKCNNMGMFFFHIKKG